MKKQIIFLLCVTLLAGEQTLMAMKRKRSEESSPACGRKKKRRKIEYDNYCRHGVYYCDEKGCDYSSKKLKNFRDHLHNTRHLGYGGRGSKYDIYRRDGVFKCPDCSYESEKLRRFSGHARRSDHAGYVKKRKSKYDVYLKDGFYCCPRQGCGYKNRNVLWIAQHIWHKEKDLYKKEFSIKSRRKRINSNEEEDQEEDDGGNGNNVLGNNVLTRFLIEPLERSETFNEEVGLEQQLKYLKTLNEEELEEELRCLEVFNEEGGLEPQEMFNEDDYLNFFGHVEEDWDSSF